MNGQFVKLLAAAALGSATMMAGTVTVEVLNDGVTPFVGELDGVSTFFVCDDNKDYVSNNESWSANETPLSQVIADVPTSSPNSAAVPGLYFGEAEVGSTHVGTTLYEEAAWLVYQFAGYPTYAAAIQTAIWDIMDQTGAGTNNGISSAAYWVSAAQGEIGSNGLYKAGGLSATQIAEVFILTPSGFSGPGLGTGSPQEFFYIAPEPRTYALFGMGLIFLSLGTFRRRRKKTD